VVRNRSSSRTHFLPKKAKMTQERLQRKVPAFISAEDWPSGSPDLNPLDNKMWAVLEDVACRKGHNNLDCLTRSLVKAAGEIQLEKVHAAKQGGWSVSRLALGQKAAILSDIIINKNLKLFLKNYLVRKGDVLFHFPSRTHNPCNKTYGKIINIYVTKLLCM
jgi:hypothetical protein